MKGVVLFLILAITSHCNAGHWYIGNATDVGTYNGNAFHTFDGKLAIAFSRGASSSTHFKQSADAGGQEWPAGSSVEVSAGTRGISFTVEQSQNAPVAISASTTTNELFVSASTDGSVWANAQTVNIFDSGVQQALFNVAGVPSLINSINSNPDEVYSSSVVDLSQKSTNTVLGQGQFSVSAVNGEPAFVAPIESGEVRFKRFDSVNNRWSSSGVSVGAPTGSAPHDLVVIDGVPVVLYGTSTAIYVAVGRDADGTAFHEPELVWAYGVFYEINAARITVDPKTNLPVVAYAGKPVFGDSRVINVIRRTTTFGTPAFWNRNFPVLLETFDSSLVYGNKGLDVASTGDDFLAIAVSAVSRNRNWIKILVNRIPPPTRPPTRAPTSLSPTTESPTTDAPTTESPTTDAPTVPTTASPTVPPTTDAPTTTASPTTGTPAPTTGTAAPTTGTAAPTTGTAAPTTGTAAPTTGTAAPTTGTAAPTTGTPAPTTPAPTDSPTVASGLPTKAPTTGAPTTEAPTSDAPTTESPTTEAPTDVPERTEVPTSLAPTSDAPTSLSPTTLAPTTDTPTTHAPTTHAPTTLAPTTGPGPTSLSPTTHAPTTHAPTSDAPTTHSPTTLAPTSDAPTSDAPTAGPPTDAPTEVPSSASTMMFSMVLVALVALLL